MRKFLFAAILLPIHFSVFAQDEQPAPKKIKITDYYLHLGTFSRTFISPTLEDFRRLAPESELLDRDLSGFYIGYGYAPLTSGVLSLMLGMKIRDRTGGYKENVRVRLGASYYSEAGISRSFWREETVAVDTFTSSGNNHVFYLDSTRSTSYIMNYTYHQVRLDGSVLFFTNPERLVSLFTGAGFSAGVSLNPFTEIRYSEYDRTSIRLPYGSYFRNTTYNSDVAASETELFRNSPNFGFSGYIPLGIDVRLGNKREFWKLLHLFYEIRPGMGITYIPELQTVVSATLHQGVGLRVGWD